MSAPGNGGPAFPQPLACDPVDGHFVSSIDCGDGGMTLRDYFAAKAMPVVWAEIPDDVGRDHALGRLGAFAYEMADAMLKAREA